MKPFLYQIADLFLREYGTGISQLAFVFPNRRAGLFFQKHLSEIANRPIFSPKILTINDQLRVVPFYLLETAVDPFL